MTNFFLSNRQIPVKLTYKLMSLSEWLIFPSPRLPIPCQTYLGDVLMTLCRFSSYYHYCHERLPPVTIDDIITYIHWNALFLMWNMVRCLLGLWDSWNLSNYRKMSPFLKIFSFWSHPILPFKASSKFWFEVCYFLSFSYFRTTFVNFDIQKYLPICLQRDVHFWYICEL